MYTGAAEAERGAKGPAYECQSDDYSEFLNHLEHYLHAVPEETTVEGINYPVGILRRGEHSVRLHFTHYGSFEEAWDKWTERAARVDLDNLYVIYEFNKPITRENPRLKQFLDLEFKNKVMLTCCETEDLKSE